MDLRQEVLVSMAEVGILQEPRVRKDTIELER